MLILFLGWNSGFHESSQVYDHVVERFLNE